MKNKLARIEAIKDLIQEAIDKGASSVQQIHQTIADLPLAALERKGLLGPEARDAQTRTISAVYDAIRKVNSEVGALVTGLFESLDDHADAQANLSRPTAAKLKTALDEAVAKRPPDDE